MRYSKTHPAPFGTLSDAMARVGAGYVPCPTRGCSWPVEIHGVCVACHAEGIVARVAS